LLLHPDRNCGTPPSISLLQLSLLIAIAIAIETEVHRLPH
jgi:hypothetical protein